MQLPKVGTQARITCYKHDGSRHRTWGKSLVLLANEDIIIVVNTKTKVREASGRLWRTNEPALCIFFPKKWYNIIVMMKSIGITYYVNVASPVIYEEETLKYIDYDLDLKMFHDGRIKILDRGEYEKHSLNMNYSLELKEVIEKQVPIVKELMESKTGWFDHEQVREYVSIWESMKKA